MVGSGRRQQQRGFTLIEAVVTIVIAAILSIGLISYIGDSVEGFASATNRNQLAGSARTVVDRLDLELSNAVPNSVRTTAPQPDGNQCLEFLPIEALTAYLDLPTTGQGDDSFRVVAFNPPFQLASPATGYHAIAYPDDVDDVYDTSDPDRGPVAGLDSIEAPGAGGSPDQQTVNLTTTHRFPRRSPADRLFVSPMPVSFCVVGRYLYRYNGYGLRDTQCTPETGGCLPDSASTGRHLVAGNIDNAGLQAFTVMPPGLRRNAVISLDLNFTDAGDNVRLIHDVLFRNVP